MQMGKLRPTEVGRDSLKATWQGVARAELEPTDPEVPSMHGALAAPVPALS